MISIRNAEPADAAALARVHVDAWRTAYAGILPADFLAGLSYERSESNWRQAIAAMDPGATVLVAETAEGEVVGFANGAPEREGNADYRGEVYSIYILKEFQRKGAGRLLLTAIARRLLADGYETLLLWVLKGNFPARRFYAAMGGKPVAEKTITIGDTELVEVAYGWKDASQIADR